MLELFREYEEIFFRENILIDKDAYNVENSELRYVGYVIANYTIKKQIIIEVSTSCDMFNASTTFNPSFRRHYRYDEVNVINYPKLFNEAYFQIENEIQL